VNSTKSSLARACAFASVAVVGVFGIGSLLESTVFRGADPAHVDLLHASRGVFSSILAAAAVAWALSRTGSPLTDTVSADPDDAGSAELARWIIRMRWVAALVLSVLVLGAARVGHLLAPGVVLPLLGTTLLVPLVNLAHMGLLRRSAAPRVGLLAQVVGDLLILTALLHWTGGIGNPLILLMALHVVIAGIVLPPRDCYLVAGVAILLSVGLAWAEVAGIFAHHPIAYGATGGPIALLPSYVAVWGAAHAVVLVAIAHFAATLSGNARSARAKLLGMAEGAVAQRGLLERALATTGTGLRLARAVTRLAVTPPWVSACRASGMPIVLRRPRAASLRRSAASSASALAIARRVRAASRLSSSASEGLCAWASARGTGQRAGVDGPAGSGGEERRTSDAQCGRPSRRNSMVRSMSSMRSWLRRAASAYSGDSPALSRNVRNRSRARSSSRI